MVADGVERPLLHTLQDWARGAEQAPWYAVVIPATSLALKLLDVQQAITDRDFDALFCAPDTPPDITQLISEIQPHTDMHDKFWRYLSLFVSTVSD